MTARDNRGKPLRHGYTTGACAAAAAKAAATALLDQVMVRDIQIDLPNEHQASFEVSQCTYAHAHASCSVIKDAGDDPDITDEAEICATVSWKEEAGISIEGGKGVGTVTKPGLEIPVGAAAINPVPRQMITNSVMQAVGGRLGSSGIRVTISVPRGEQLAKRTLNRRLGIINGLSILGTTGIVVPYSVNAYTACISQAVDIAVACGCREVVLTTGRRSEKFAQQQLASPEESFVQAGDFIGYSLAECVKKGLDKVIIWGMIGKVSKLATGYLYTNVSDSEVNIAFLVGIAAKCGIPDETLRPLRQAVTANHLRKMLPPEHISRFCDTVCLAAARKCWESVEGKIEVECIMTDPEGTILGRADVKG